MAVRKIMSLRFLKSELYMHCGDEIKYLLVSCSLHIHLHVLIYKYKPMLGTVH